MIGRELFRCFSRVVDKEEVITCSSELEDDLTDADDIDPWTLLDMMVCAEEINNQWVLDHVDQTDMDKTRQLVLDLETYTHRCARPAEYEKARRLAIAENPRWIREKNDELFTTSMGHLVPIPFCKPLVAGKERDVLHDFRIRSVTSPPSCFCKFCKC